MSEREVRGASEASASKSRAASGASRERSEPRAPTAGRDDTRAARDVFAKRRRGRLAAARVAGSLASLDP